MPLPLPGVIAASLIALAQASGSSPYLDIVNQYRAGQYAEAITALVELSDGRSGNRVTQELESIIRHHTGETDPMRAPKARQLALADVLAAALPAAAALHFETGYYLMQVRQDDEAGADHLHLARQIVDSPRFSLVMRITPDLKEQQTRFRRDIYLGVLWTLQADHSNDRLVTHLQRLLDEFPDDADVMLAFGSFEEYQSSGPVVRELRPPTAVMAAGPWRRNMQERQLKRAERYYRDALKLKPSLHEARLRLGRVLQLRGLLSEAQAELLASLEPGSPATIRYLASMFLADVLDAQGNGAAALARVRDVVTRFPGCQSSHLALSRIHESRGDRAAALAALEPLWKEQPARDCVDPWWGYHLGQIWRVLALVDSLHARVRDAR